MIDLVTEALHKSLDRRTAIWKQGEALVVATAWSLDDETPITLFVTEAGDDTFVVSDAGLAAGALADAGVDLSARNAGASFELLQQHRLGPAVGERQWDLALSVPGAKLGDAIIELSETVIRAEGLKALARRRPARNFGDRIVKVASEVGLRVEPRAKLPLRYRNATRQVSYRLIGERRDVYVQSVTRSGVNAAYDHARALFADASVPVERRMTVIESGVQLDSWQQEGLSEVSAVVTEPAMPKALADLAA